ncbi:MAG: hypothetical protein QOF48_3528 [Verrucomicrobiota bacterium]
MAIHVALQHKTHYTYDQPVHHGPHVVRLRPAPHCRTRILSYSQRVSGKHFVNWQQDPFSNWNARLVFPEKLKEFSVDVELIAEMSVYNPFDFFVDPTAAHYPFEYDATLRKDLAPFLEPCDASPKVAACIADIRRELLGTSAGAGQKSVHGKSASPAAALGTIDFVVALNQRLQRSIHYLLRLEPGVQTPEETLSKLSGSCRDTGWLLVQLARHFGIAARFVSGYLIQLAPDVKSLDGPSGTPVDFTDLHAWCEVYLPGAGWVGFDPTSGLLAGEGHIPLSCTPEPASSAPVSGIIDPCKSELHHEMTVTRILESPRVTKPYSEGEWTEIEKLGRAIDLDLTAQDVRLTMGGEPTFISLDDPEGPEWNSTASSPAKRVLSHTLLKRLRARFAPGSLLHHGQGKWYPGESLPRWAFGCYWRKDGIPIWRDDSLFATEGMDYKATATESAEFAKRLAIRLGADPQWIIPAFEDPFYHAWKERRLPANVAPHKAGRDDDEDRTRLARILGKGIGATVGHALPIQRTDGTQSASWISGPWFLRADRLYLSPGDSPMGLRLPLDSLPWVSESDFPRIYETDPTVPRPPLPSPEEFRQRRLRMHPPVAPRPAAIAPGSGLGKKTAGLPLATDDSTRRPETGESAPWIVRTALCVEAREGRLHVFMPPVPALEDYLELVMVVEDTAAELKMPVVLEGYPPPRDPRLQVLKVTPDPGVIEVNLHPSKTWEELVERTTVLYDEARQARLGTEKFMQDGRHTGTGGGNHILIGSEMPADSPVLRRPDLLRSLIAYWQNHPSLSWLFSGLFIGPMSQAPRIDEARNDSVYELEVAFRELDRQIGKAKEDALISGKRHGTGGAAATPGSAREIQCAPWLADRLFRDLLIDSSGNTHRAEFSIDKLFSPDGAAGRLGLVEMRAFEMPPHSRMSLAQHLLLRGLIAMFWKRPFRGNLVRWGTDIHDRWMLPHFCEADFNDVIRELQNAGHAFRSEWFQPHFEFRFPRIGEFSQGAVHIELRTALEPWHVLGEAGAPGGTVRYVDSSLERLQIKVRGLTGNRYALTVNGCAIPLHPTGTNGEAVAGVRYRAWQPPHCLQPTIGVHTPLSFDLYDTWNNRSLGGCQYHVTHPGGRHYSTFPVNAYEAESRRLARFFIHGATQKEFVPAPAPRSDEFPFTLDMRAT